MIAAAKPKISFPFFVGSAHLAKLKTPSRLRLDGVLTQILKCGEGGIQLRIKFCRRKIFASRASQFRLLAKHRSGVRIPHAKQAVALPLTE